MLCITFMRKSVFHTSWNHCAWKAQCFHEKWNTLWNSIVQFSIVQHSIGYIGQDRIIQYEVVQHIIVEYSIIQYSIVQYSILQHSIAQHSIVQYSIVQYSIVQYGMVQYGIVSTTPARCRWVLCSWASLQKTLRVPCKVSLGPPSNTFKRPSSTANFCTKNLLSGGLTQPNSYL